MRRNISANIVSIGSMRIAEVREEMGGGGSRVVCRSDPSIFLRTAIARGESPPSVIHRDLITVRRTADVPARTLYFSPSRLSLSYMFLLY